MAGKSKDLGITNRANSARFSMTLILLFTLLSPGEKAKRLLILPAVLTNYVLEKLDFCCSDS
jgi:hypothetical protein